MTLISGYGQSLFAPLKTKAPDGTQQMLHAQNWRFSDQRVFSESAAPAAGLLGAGFAAPVAPSSLVAVQEMAQADDAATPIGPQTAREKFLAFQQMSTTEKYRALLLGEMGLTEEDLATMTPEEREKIEAEIRERVKELIEKDLREKQQQDALPPGHPDKI
jgi:hypothetical protein